MLKNILNLEGAQNLSKEAQKSINGGIGPCVNTGARCASGPTPCPRGQACELIDDGINPPYGICKCI